MLGNTEGSGALLILWTAAGLSLFSFVNVLVWRLPRNMNFLTDRSRCPFCGQTLNWRDLIPVFSWLLLKGRCRYCGEKIPLRYPLTELWGGFCSLLCAKFWGISWNAGVMLMFLALLTAVSQIDQDTMEIPDGLNGAIFLLAVLALAQDGLLAARLDGWELAKWMAKERLLGMISVSLPMFLLILMIPGAFGGGDVKLMAGIGLFLGWRRCLVSFMAAVLTGGIYGGFLILTGRKGRKDHFAFGPFLCAGAGLAAFFGNQILQWYLSAFFCSIP